MSMHQFERLCALFRSSVYQLPRAGDGSGAGSPPPALGIGGMFGAAGDMCDEMKASVVNGLAGGMLDLKEHSASGASSPGSQSQSQLQLQSGDSLAEGEAGSGFGSGSGCCGGAEALASGAAPLWASITLPGAGAGANAGALNGWQSGAVGALGPQPQGAEDVAHTVGDCGASAQQLPLHIPDAAGQLRLPDLKGPFGALVASGLSLLSALELRSKSAATAAGIALQGNALGAASAPTGNPAENVAAASALPVQNEPIDLRGGGGMPLDLKRLPSTNGAAPANAVVSDTNGPSLVNRLYANQLKRKALRMHSVRTNRLQKPYSFVGGNSSGITGRQTQWPAHSPVVNVRSPSGECPRTPLGLGVSGHISNALAFTPNVNMSAAVNGAGIPMTPSANGSSAQSAAAQACQQCGCGEQMARGFAVLASAIAELARTQMELARQAEEAARERFRAQAAADAQREQRALESQAKLLQALVLARSTEIADGSTTLFISGPGGCTALRIGAGRQPEHNEEAAPVAETDEPNGQPTTRETNGHDGADPADPTEE